MGKIFKGIPLDQDVYTLALERMNRYFDRFDHIGVLFSGGKDSTACLNLALHVARERNRLPLDVVHFDEEAIPPETVEYVERVESLPDVALRWYCTPVQHRNGCSRKEAYWYAWAEEKRDIWCRDLPDTAIREIGFGFDRHPMPDCNKFLWPETNRTTGIIIGLRADESFSRRRALLKSIVDNDMTIRDDLRTTCAPIYDWRAEDIWFAPHRLGWDYNRAYDTMESAGISWHKQRCAPPYGEEPMQGLWQFQVCWPQLWDKMSKRVPGAATAARYAATKLYGHGGMIQPRGQSWKELVRLYLSRHTPEVRENTAKSIKQLLALHKKKTNDPLPMEKAHHVTGLSWCFITMLALRGDLKQRRARQHQGKAFLRPETMTEENLEAYYGTRF